MDYPKCEQLQSLLSVILLPIYQYRMVLQKAEMAVSIDAIL